MVDRVTSERRSEIMRSVGQKDTGAEMKVRRALHLLGYRYRLHRRELPGKPDIVFPSRRKTVFVHGCFWHGHNCRFGRLPKSNLDYWVPKIAANRERDERNVAALRDAGWAVFVVWQCDLRDLDGSIRRIVEFLDGAAGLPAGTVEP